MKQRIGFLMGAAAVIFLNGCQREQAMILQSPDGNVSVQFILEDGKPFYAVRLEGETLLEPSPLGLVRADGDFTGSLKPISISRLERITDEYTMPHGKQSRIRYQANRRVITLENPQKQRMEIVFQVSNDGAAFRYQFPESGEQTSMEREATGFAFPRETVSWLHPMHDSKTGWEKTYPSYESHYEIEKPVGRPSPFAAGWAFPALFRVGRTGWVLLSESGVYETYCGCRLGRDSEGGLYRIAFPQADEHRGPQDPVAPAVRLPFASPWRLVIVGRGLETIVQSNLATDVAEESKVKDTSFIKPGRAAWSWLRYDTAGTELPVLRKFLDLAADMGWEYMLVDADWDRILGYDRVAELSKEAQNRGVELILWYNSNGDWNNAPPTPKNRMHLPDVRREEFKRISEMGIRGIKVDFFGGDKQATMQLYREILKDAAEYNLVVNFHGATLPRGWQRTWPNMVTTEAVMGMEYCTFDQRNADRQPEHACVLPFTRNVVAPMDFTPVVMSRRIRGVRRVTTPAFELALPVIFESGVQHFGLAPFEAEQLPDFALEYLKNVPAAWDRTRFVAGYPGKEVVLARQKGAHWYVAAVNGENKTKTLSPDLSFLPKGCSGLLIKDGPDDTLLSQTIHERPDSAQTFQVPPYGGFVLHVSAN